MRQLVMMVGVAIVVGTPATALAVPRVGDIRFPTDDSITQQVASLLELLLAWVASIAG